MWLVGVPLAASTAAAQTAAARLAIKGYDPVSYFTDGKPIEGKPEYEMVFDDTRYRFASAQHLALFKSDPDRYAPQYAGSCAAGVALGVKVEAEPEHWLIVDGKLFVFSSASTVEQMRADPRKMMAKGQENWKHMAGNPAQR
jgi:YHS domain-containing protein